VAYRYRKWNLGNDIVLICRCELDAVQQVLVPHHTIPYHIIPYHSIPVPRHTIPYPGLWCGSALFNADPDPAFFIIADTDTDPVPNPGF
jgi:hypothetical protein